MRIVFVHGRNQAGKDRDALQQTWTEALADGLTTVGYHRLTDHRIEMPFYGDVLDRLTKEGPAPGEIVFRSTGGDDSTTTAAMGELTLDLTAAAGITDEDIAAEVASAGHQVVARGPENWEWVQAAARLLERRVPWTGRFAIRRFAADVAAYLTRPKVARTIEDLVRRDIGDGPALVIGHSLGSVVALKALHRPELAQVHVPLFVTLGSPLGIASVRKYVRPEAPKPVARWLNASDERDFVALHSTLLREHFGIIENTTEVRNPRDDPHGVAGYLRDRHVATRVAEVLDS